MKYRVIGWAHYDDADIAEGEVGWAARNAVADDIKAHGYLFSGYDHQERNGCAPVLNDGKIRRFSQRAFGGIMAEAHGYTGRMDYALFSFDVRGKTPVLPESRFSREDFQPEKNLNENFVIDASEESFAAAREGKEIKLDDLPGFRYMDKGDTITLKCGGQTADYTVVDVERKKDMTKEERLSVEAAFYDLENRERQRQAEEFFEKARTVMMVKLEECAHTCEVYLRFVPVGQDTDDAAAEQPLEKFPFETEEENRDLLAEALNEFSAVVRRAGADLEVNRNADYDVDVNVMIRRTIACFVGKEEELKTLCKRYESEAWLVIAPRIFAKSEQPAPVLSLDDDVIAFLYRSGVKMDLDYYIL